MNLHLYQCRACATVTTTPQHLCPATGRTAHSSIVIRHCEVCGERLPAGHARCAAWCAAANRAKFAEAQARTEAACNLAGDDIDQFIDALPRVDDWQRKILRQLVEKWLAGEEVKVAMNSRRPGMVQLHKDWARIEKRLRAEAKETQ